MMISGSWSWNEMLDTKFGLVAFMHPGNKRISRGEKSPTWSSRKHLVIKGSHLLFCLCKHEALYQEPQTFCTCNLT